jgi:hypothetical protein
MKRTWTLLVVGAFAALLALPQPAAAGVRFGLKAGANVANVNGDAIEELQDWQNTVGFCGGIFLEFNLGKVLTIQPEVLYTMKGSETAEGGKLDLDYIEVPVLLKVRLPIASIHPFLIAGPAFGWNLKAVVDGIEVEDWPTSDYSAVFGAGLQLGRTLHLDVRYTMGLAKLEIPDLETIDLKNGVISATLGLTF